MEKFWDRIYYGNSVMTWSIAITVVLIVLMALRFTKFQLVLKLKRWSEVSENNFDDFVVHLIESSIIPFLHFATIFAGAMWLSLPERVDNVLGVAMLLVTTFYVLRTTSAILEYTIITYLARQANGESKQKQVRGILIILKVLIWLFGLIFLLDNFGYDITTIIAGLGIGGIAVALAAQTILGDLFSYFVILFDRPFEIGDFIIVEDKMGVIEYIGVKTTRLRTLGGEQLICSNKDLTDSRIHNYKRMEKRRVAFQIGVTYQTDPDTLEAIPNMVKSIIVTKPDVQFDRGHLSAFGDSSLNFEFIYFILSADYSVFMETQQRVFFEIYRLFKEKGISFAYPTQTLFLDKDPESDLNISAG